MQSFAILDACISVQRSHYNNHKKYYKYSSPLRPSMTAATKWIIILAYLIQWLFYFGLQLSMSGFLSRYQNNVALFPNTLHF